MDHYLPAPSSKIPIANLPYFLQNLTQSPQLTIIIYKMIKQRGLFIGGVSSSAFWVTHFLKLKFNIN